MGHSHGYRTRGLTHDLPAWQPRGGWTSLHATGFPGSKGPGGLSDLVLEVRQHLFYHVLLVESVTSPLRAQGGTWVLPVDERTIEEFTDMF